MIKYIAPILLLTISNIFMTFAWYGHLKFKAAPIVLVVLVSWGIAFFEYCFQVPANRIGSYVYNAAQLKTIQEVNRKSSHLLYSAFSPYFTSKNNSNGITLSDFSLSSLRYSLFLRNGKVWKHAGIQKTSVF